MTGGGESAFECAHQFRNRTVQIVREMPDGAAVARLARANADGLKQNRRGDVMGMGDEGNRHPSADGLIFPTGLAEMAAGPNREEERSGDRQD
jgi:hypothetical protein